MAVPAEREVFRDDLLVLTEEAGGRLIRARRTAVPLTTAGLIDAADRFLRLYPMTLRKRLVLLVDTRAAPLMANNHMEQSMADAVGRMLDGFSRHALLVRTAVGRLQAQRIDRERGGSATIFDDEGEAFAYLLEDDPVSSIRKPRSSRF